VTWLDHQPRAQVDAAIGELSARPELVEKYADRARNDDRYALWLAMVDGHLETLPDPHGEVIWDWHDSYQAGWAPRATAFAAWASTDPEPDPTSATTATVSAGMVAL
jgi:hypothetical protein